MMKFISSIVAFSLTFIISVALIGVPQRTTYTNIAHPHCHNSQVAAGVVELLRQDISNGEVRRKEINQFFERARESSYVSDFSYADYIREYVDKSQSMDDSNLPADFRYAWRRHMKAWRDYSDFLNKLKISSVRLSYAEFIEMDRKYSREINRTWYQTLRIGKKYDPDLNYKIY